MYIHSACKHGDVKFGKDGIAMMFVNGSFHPICGHYFWNKPWAVNGAMLFCKKMGYKSGIISQRTVPLSDPAVQVGRCKETDVDVANCTGGICIHLI